MRGVFSLAIGLAIRCSPSLRELTAIELDLSVCLTLIPSVCWGVITTFAFARCSQLFRFPSVVPHLVRTCLIGLGVNKLFKYVSG